MNATPESIGQQELSHAKDSKNCHLISNSYQLLQKNIVQIVVHQISVLCMHWETNFHFRFYPFFV
jgi:hypothetical protein